MLESITPPEITSAEIRSKLSDLSREITTKQIDMASMVAKVYHEGLWRQWGPDGTGKPYQKFEEYTTKELGIEYRKAMYFVQVGDMVNAYGQNIKDSLESLGWTKVKDLARILNKDNLEEWLNLASSMNAKELQKAVADALSGSGVDNPPDKITTITLRCDSSAASIILDAINEAKKTTETSDIVSAIEYICLDWMETKGESTGSIEKTSIEDMIKFMERLYGVRLGRMSLASEGDTDDVSNGTMDDSELLGADDGNLNGDDVEGEESLLEEGNEDGLLFNVEGDLLDQDGGDHDSLFDLLNESEE